MPVSTINPSSISALGYGFKNRIINGAMGIWQRGTSGFSSGAYCADRWIGLNTTTVAQSSDTPSSAFYFSLEFANTSATFPLALQRIESVNAQDLVGQQVTLSFWAKNVSGSAILYCELNYPNAKDNFSSITAIQSLTASASPSSSWTFYTLTFNALPSQVANGLEVRIVRNNASAASTRITGVQLERGVVATAFDFRPYGTELIMCQRYYEKSYSIDTVPGSGGSFPPGILIGPCSVQGSTTSTTLIENFTPMQVSKRAAPTVALYDHVNTVGVVSRINSNLANNAGQSGGAVRASTQGFTVSSASGAAANCLAYSWVASSEL